MTFPWVIAGACTGARRWRRERGFTLIELIVVIGIVAVLAAVAIPRLMDDAFARRGFHDAVKALLQHARRTAIASRRYECVDITGGTVVSLTRDTAVPEGKAGVSCSVAIALPAPGRGCAAANQVCAPSNVTMTGTTSLIFDPMGRLVTAPGTVAGAAASIAIADQPNITVAPETGYVQ